MTLEVFERPSLGEIDQLAVTAMRMLSIDQVEAANSGHPGLPLGLAPTMYAIMGRVMKHDPTDPSWIDRDRLVLSAGHGSALLYSALHLFGYSLALDELREFRQWGSLTPGHPEFGHTPGVEVTTGPLGQGIATAVGLALAERMLASRVNSVAGEQIISHRTFVLASDGDLMEGLSHEAGSLAGHLGLGRLVVCFDDNGITIDGPAGQSCSDNAGARFAAYGWQVLKVEDGNDLVAIEAALVEACADESRPTLISVKTKIGAGAPNKEGKSAAHGAPLGAQELIGTKEYYGWPSTEMFYVPSEAREHFALKASLGAVAHKDWETRLQGLLAASDEFKETWNAHFNSKMDPFSLAMPNFEVGTSRATRAASNSALEWLASNVTNFVGGSADLAESTGTKLSQRAISADDYSGKNIHYGIREHAMAACSNGISLHGGFRPFCSTFLVFSDYLRPSLRLSALMGLPVSYVFSHDSVAVGEDGPTHQPIEHVNALRAIPNVAVLRPADSNETVEAWRLALARSSGPTALILSRQALPTLLALEPGWMGRTGARVVREGVDPRAVLIATGSEVSLAVAVATALKEHDGIDVRVISMPWRERFFELSVQEADAILGSGIPRFVAEAGISLGWDKIVGNDGLIFSVDRFGASAPGPEVMEKLGLSVSRIVGDIKSYLSVADRAPTAINDESLTDIESLSSVARTLLLATEAASVSCQSWVGKGDKNSADEAAVRAMREVLGSLEGRGVVVIGEGEKDKAPMLHNGEVVGRRESPAFDIAVDPLEGTNFCARGAEGSIAVVAVAPQGSMWATKGYYMDKLVVGPEAASVVDITLPVEDNLRLIAKALAKEVSELRVTILSKPRHKELIERVRRAGASVVEVPDGDVMASIKVMLGSLDALFGIGGAPEGVISACAAKELGATFQGRLAPQSEEEATMLDEESPGWRDMVLNEAEMVKGDSIVAFSAVTGGYPLLPPRFESDVWTIDSMVLEKGSLKRVTRGYQPGVEGRSNEMKGRDLA